MLVVRFGLHTGLGVGVGESSSWGALSFGDASNSRSSSAVSCCSICSNFRFLVGGVVE